MCTRPIPILIQYYCRNGYEENLRWRRICNLRYADDIALIATSQQELQQLMDRLHGISGKYTD